MKYVVYIALLFVACSKPQMDDCITSLGKYKSITRSVSAFNKLYVDDRIEVELVQDSILAGQIELIGPSNLLGQITSEVKEDELRLTNSNICNFVRSFDYSLKVKVYINTISRLEIASIATITSSDTLYLENLEIYHNALSDIDLILECSNEVYVKSLNSASTFLRGRSKVLKGSIEEVSLLDARALHCQEVLIDSHTPLNCYVSGSKGLFVKIYNSGNVYYMLEPSDYKALDVRRGEGDLLLLK